jgi:hypothetical protein
MWNPSIDRSLEGLFSQPPRPLAAVGRELWVGAVETKYRRPQGDVDGRSRKALLRISLVSLQRVSITAPHLHYFAPQPDPTTTAASLLNFQDLRPKWMGYGIALSHDS